MPRTRVILLFLALIALGCDSKPKAPTFVPPEREPEGPTYEIELQPLTPLAVGRQTHVVVDSLGNICWVQESPKADDILFIMGEDKIPRSTTLTVPRICDALGEPGGTGNIQSIAAARNGEIYFYFSGARARKTLTALGLYSNRTGAIRIIDDSDALMSGTGFGKSIALARGTVISQGNTFWLWVRHTDDSCLLRLRYPDIPARGNLPLESRVLNVRFGDRKQDLTSPDYALAPAGEETVYWLDRAESMLYTIDQNGQVKMFKSLVGLPVAMSLPMKTAPEEMMLFFADAPAAEVKNLRQLDLPRVKVRTTFPAMVILERDVVRTVPRERISSYPGLSLSAMRVGELAAVEKGKGWVAYDSVSGQLLRMTMRQRQL
ncbi:MAG TPA: hypothetical protein VF669_08645 [Tepidisphaeraceae bacterium]|jgi:hypothetical protein